MINVRLPLFGFLLSLSSPAFAEVADKVPTTLQLWILPAIITAIAFIIAVKRPILALFLLPIALFCAWGHVDELHDPFLGPALRAELGEAYFVHGYLSAAMAIAGPFLAWAVLWFYRSRTRRQP
jgi:hypothetical protein